jgi:RHS repeat-associated protein
VKHLGRRPRRTHVLLIVIIGLSAVVGSMSVGRLFGQAPGSTSPSQPKSANAAAVAAVAAAKATATVNRLHPAPIHANDWSAQTKAPRGFQPGLSRPVPQQTTAKSRTFANPDGTLTTQLYQTSVNYQGSDGAWHTIDPTLGAHADGSIHNKAGPGDIAFAATLGAGPMVTVSLGANSLSLYAPQMGASAKLTPFASGTKGVLTSWDTITYANAWPGVDLQFSTTLHTVKSLIILHAAPTGSSDLVFRFPITVNGVSAHPSADGSIGLVDAQGRTQLVMPPGTMSDSNMDPKSGNSPTAGVTYSLDPQGRSVDVVASRAWLTDSARKYPVYIDPSTNIYGTGNDAYFADAYPTSNYHARYDSGQSDYNDWVGYSNGSTGTNWTVMGFDTSPVNGAKIISATWYGYFEWSSSCSATPYWLYRATSSWGPTSVTWNTRPSTSADSSSGSVAANWQGCGSEGRTWSTADVTSWVQGWALATYPNYGLVLNEAGNGSTYWKKIAGDETTLNGAWPAISVNYERFGSVNWGFQNDAQNPPQYPQNGNPSFLGPNATTPSNMWVYVANQGSYTWPANGAYGLAYHVYNATGTTQLFHDGSRAYVNTSVVPGNGLWLKANIAAFSGEGLAEGSYVLRWDMIEEFVAWFSDVGVATADFHILVAAPPAPTSPGSGSTVTTLTPTLNSGTCTACASYQFQVSTDQNFNGYAASSGWQSPTSWTPINPLQPGTKYYWRAIGRDAYKASTGWSSAYNFTTASAPGAPTGASASGSNGAATLSWTAPSNGGSAITGYVVTPYVGSRAQTPVNEPASPTNATLSGLANGGAYTFTVMAQNVMGKGVASGFSSPVTPAGTPSTPGGVTATPGNGQVGVAWSAPAANGSPITGYTVKTYQGGSLLNSLNVGATPTSAAITNGISNGTAYTFAVLATNAVGSGSASGQTAAVTPGPGPTAAFSLDAGQYARGASATATATLTPYGESSDSGVTLTFSAPLGYDASAPTTLINGAQCANVSGVTCSNTKTTVTVSGLAVPGGGVTVTTTLRAMGSDAGCVALPVSITATNPAGKGVIATVSATTCDGGLGAQKWWRFVGEAMSVGGTAQVNAANGNLVLSQTDTTTFQLHGHLKLGTSRTYNSEITAHPGGEVTGLGWTTAWVNAGDTVGGVALRVAADEHVGDGQIITLIDDTGARVAFQPQYLTTPVDVTGLGASTGPLGPLVPTSLTVGTGYNRLCVDTSYASEAGVHASMWRYLESQNGACSGTGMNSKILGYATITVDRVRREYSADGRLLSVRDALGNRVDLSYDGSNRLTRVGETGGSNRAYSLTYTTWASGPEVDVTDPAGRVTKYQQDSGGHLLNVLNPDSSNSALHYTYGGCSGSAEQLCSATDANGSSISVSYATAALGPAIVHQISTRVGTATTFTYAADGSSTVADTGTERRRFAAIDSAGRVGEIDEGDTSGNWLRITLDTWDSAGCRQPDSGTDNNLCDALLLALNNGATLDAHIVYTYNDEGGVVIKDQSATPSPDILTTSSYAAQYVESSGTVRAFSDSITGSGHVSSGSSGRRDNTTVYVVSDQTGSLSPNGNAAGSGYAAYQTTYTVDANNTVGAGLVIGATNPCSGSGVNSGRVCQSAGPSRDGVHATVTSYMFDAYGQNTAMTTPDVNAGSQSGYSYAYTYFSDTDFDLTGTTHAGGWLRAVTDPTGKPSGTPFGPFVAYGYDAAGNVVRTWARNATAGHTNVTDFPGSLALPTNNAYSETVYGAGTGNLAYSNPWRYAVRTRDALGNVTSYSLDKNGNRLAIRPPRGNVAGNASYDVVQSFDANDHVKTVQQPVEALLNGSPHTTNTYDQYGNLASTQNPDGNFTTFSYDAANRAVGTNWTRGQTIQMATPQGCRASASGDLPIPSGYIVCSKATTYDGVDNVVGVANPGQANDGTGSTVQTIYHFDAAHRQVRADAPRYDGTYRSLETDTVYDQDGNVTESCPPREFIEGSTHCVNGLDHWSTHKVYNAADLLVSSAAYNSADQGGATWETTSYTYDADGNRLTVADPRGGNHVTTNAYDVLDRLRSTSVPRDSVPANNTVTSFGYDPSGNRIWTSVPVLAQGVASVRDTLVSYDADNRPLDNVVAATTTGGTPTTDITQIGVTDSSGGKNIHTRQTYDPDGHVIATFSPRAFAQSATTPIAEFMVRVDYDADGRPVTQWVPRYDTGDAAVRFPPTGLSTNYQVFTGQASQATDCPTGASPLESGYGAPAYPATTGVCITAVNYDAAGRVTKQLMATAAGSGTSPRYNSFSYTDDGLVWTATTPDPSNDSNRVTTTSQYDANRNLVSSTDPATYVTSKTWSLDGLNLSIQNPPGSGGLTHSSGMTYDANGNATSTVDGYGAITLTAYTTDNLKLSVATPSGGAQVGGVSDNNPYTTSYTYDGVGNVMSTKSPNATAGDADNPGGTPTTFEYTYDNLLWHTNTPNTGTLQPRQITNTYDPSGQRISQDSKVGTLDGGSLTYQYYLDGRLSQAGSRDPAGTPAKTYSYDADGNTISWQESGHSAGLSSYYIDGTLLSTNNYAWTFDWSYDGRGQMATTSTFRSDGTGNTYAEAAHYSNVGLLDGLRTSQAPNNYELRLYDNLGRPNATSYVSGGQTQNALYYTFNLDSTLSSVGLNQGGTQLVNWSYVYDQNYRVLYAGESYPGAPSSLTYSYLPDGRIGQYGVSQGAVTYFSYDHDGNRTGWNPPNAPSGTVVSTYNPDDSLKQTRNNSGSVNVVYDAAGRIMADGCTTYTYDGFDRMTAANSVTSSRPAECGTLPGGASTATSYSYDALDRQTVVWDGSGPWTRHFSTMGTEVGVTQYSCCTTQHDRWMVNDNSGTPSQVVDIQSAGTTQWLWSNGQGNLGEVTTSTGATACLLQYDLNGGALFGTSPTNPCISGGGQFTNLGYKFASRDATTGDYTFGTRTYDPSKGAFATPDGFSPGSTSADVSIGSDPLTADLYSYVNGDPVNRIDPTGHRYTTGNDYVDAQGTSYCQTCYTNPTRYTTGGRPTCNAACHAEMSSDRKRAVANDQAHAAARDAAPPPPCSGPHASAYGCSDPGGGRTAAPSFGVSDPGPNMYTPSALFGQRGPGGPYVGSGQFGLCTINAADGGNSLLCPDASGNNTLTAEQYAPGNGQPWYVNLMIILTLGKGPGGFAGSAVAAGAEDAATIGAADATAGGDTFVIGRTADVAPFRGVPGYRTFELNGQPYTWEANQAWLQQAVKNGNAIKVVSELTPENMASSRFGISAFGRELRFLWNEGFSPDPFADVGQIVQSSPVAP